MKGTLHHETAILEKPLLPTSPLKFPMHSSPANGKKDTCTIRFRDLIYMLLHTDQEDSKKQTN